MATYLRDLPNLVIASGATASQIVQGFDDAQAAYIWSTNPITGGYTGTITVSVVKNDSTATDTCTRADLTSGGSDVTVAAGNVTPITDTGFVGLMVYSSQTETGVRTFPVTKRVHI